MIIVEYAPKPYSNDQGPYSRGFGFRVSGLGGLLAQRGGFKFRIWSGGL